MTVQRSLVAFWLILALFAGVGAWRSHQFALAVVAVLFLIIAIYIARADPGGSD